ncbi:MAG: AMP-binding protein [Thermodesulfobacteriota bacterium]|nr:AMP-binding protein [Thermodesulfobacteriota bacterium]
MAINLRENLMRRQCLGDGFRRASIRCPSKYALIACYSDEKTAYYTYRELNEKINRVANSLQALGTKKGDRVAVLSRNNADFLILTYALIKIGAWYAPINFMLRGPDIERLIDFAEPRFFFVEDAFVDLVKGMIFNTKSIEKFGYISVFGGTRPEGWIDLGELMEGDDQEPDVIIDDEDVATLLFTSGTEADPKGVLTTHKNFYASIQTHLINIGFSQEDVFLLSLPIIHMGGFFLAIMGSIIGQTLVLTYLPDPSQMLKLIDKYKVTTTGLPPTLYVAILAVPDLKKYDLSSAKRFITWSSTIPKAMVDGWNEIAPHLSFHTLQGSSESSAAAITGSWFKKWEDIPNQDGRWVGKAVAFGCDIMLVDDDDCEVPVGEAGEEIIRGPVVMRGYYKNEEANKKSFCNGWFHTGDILFKDENGDYFFADRKKDMIKTGGENVFCQEVENIIGTHPDVVLCAVFGLPDARWGEAVTVAVVPRPGVTLTEEKIISFCKERLPSFKVPKRIFFRETLPISAANKILKRDLKKEYMSL